MNNTEKRKGQRTPIELAASFGMPQGNTPLGEASIENISSGGFCFVSSSELDIGVELPLKVKLRPGDQVEVNVKVAWCQKISGEKSYMCGVEISEKDGLEFDKFLDFYKWELANYENQPIFLQAFHGVNKKIPVWIMRQAGRYLPEYRLIKERYSLEEMFHTPELAADITCMPISIMKADAAILFADILTLPAAMGFDIKFDNKKGPIIQADKDLDRIGDFTDLSYIEKTIKLVNEQLPSNIPLIGFAGGPFTVLTYLVEGGSSINFTKTLKFAYSKPASFHKLMKILTKNTIEYLNLQKNAGIKAFQIFDSWAGILRPADFAQWVLPYVQQIFEQVDLPSIYFIRNCGHLLKFMTESKADFVSVCHTVEIGNNSILGNSDIGVQGNLFNGLLYSDYPTIESEIRSLLQAVRQNHKRYIFNLSHGVFPDFEVDKVKFVVEKVHEFDW